MSGVAVNVTDSPSQIVSSPIAMLGTGLTVTCPEAFASQPFNVYNTSYVDEDVGLIAIPCVTCPSGLHK